MLIIGERINTSRDDIEPAVKERDEECITRVAQEQIDCGADLIDVNCGTLVKNEAEALTWLVEVVQKNCDQVPLCIDSPNAEALKAALKLHEGQAMINSITAEKERFEAILPLVQKYNCKVIALCMDDTGMPDTAEERFDIATRLVEDLREGGVAEDRIYIDPLVRPISTGADYGRTVLDTIRFVKDRFDDVHTTCGLSNISYGLPLRRLLNQTFLTSCMTAGLDSAILDPVDRKLMSVLRAAEALLGEDQFGMNYITAQRKGELEL